MPSVSHPKVVTSASTPRSGRRSRFSPVEDQILVRDVLSAKVHIATNGETVELSEQFAAYVS